MEWILGGVAVFVVAGICLAIYEKRKGIRIIDERGRDGDGLSQHAPDIARAQDAFRQPGFEPPSGQDSNHS